MTKLAMKMDEAKHPIEEVWREWAEWKEREKLARDSRNGISKDKKKTRGIEERNEDDYEEIAWAEIYMISQTGEEGDS